MRILHLLLMAGVAVAASGSLLLTQQDKTIYDEDVKAVASTADMQYSHVITMARIQGTVIVKATLGKDGSVAAASAISGHPLLIPSCLANAMTWKFKPNPQKSAVIVYEFRYGQGVCPNGAFTLYRPPNLVVVMECEPLLNRSSSEEK